jgi:ribonuclease HII
MTGMTAGAAAHRSPTPSLRVERELQRAGHRLVAGMDEVGRGALAGPVSVGVVVVDEVCRSAPVGVKDSKLLSHQVRERLVPKIRRWATAYAVGHASPEEIDCFGIMIALRFAGNRALAALPLVPDLIILDGNYDWLTDPGRVGLLSLLDSPADLASGAATVAGMPGTPHPRGVAPVAPYSPVKTIIKADMSCSSVAAASVLAKVERDAMMVALAGEVPDYAWELNKGYSAPEHFAALQAHGPSVHHRRSWRLPGVGGLADVEALAVSDLSDLSDLAGLADLEALGVTDPDALDLIEMDPPTGDLDGCPLRTQ